MQLPTARDAADDQLLRAIGADVHDAAARIAGEKIAGRGREHAFGPVEIGAREGEVRKLELKIQHADAARIAPCVFCRTIKSFAAHGYAEL